MDEVRRAGRIRPGKALDATLASHDSCYLGRYNGIREAPRRVARAVPGLRVVELPRSGARGLCCGGGGGHMVMEGEAKKPGHPSPRGESLHTEAGNARPGCPVLLAAVGRRLHAEAARGKLPV